MAVQLCCFIAYLICISFSVCQFPSAFLAKRLANHLEFIKYFPLLYFTFHFQTFFSPPLPQNALHFQLNRKGGEDLSPFHSFGVVPDSRSVYAGIQWGILDLEYLERCHGEWAGSEDGKSHIAAWKGFIGEMKLMHFFFCPGKKQTNKDY